MYAVYPPLRRRREKRSATPGFSKVENFGTKITQDAPVSVTDPVFQGSNLSNRYEDDR